MVAGVGPEGALVGAGGGKGGREGGITIGQNLFHTPLSLASSLVAGSQVHVPQLAYCGYMC